MNYLQYWSLHRKPFWHQGPEGFFAGPPQREALAGISYLIGSSESLAMLICQPGNGLSRLLAQITGMRGFGDQASELVLTPSSTDDSEKIIRSLATALGFDSSIANLDRHIDRAIVRLHEQEMKLVWLLDHGHPTAVAIAADLAVRHANLSVVIGVAPDQRRQTVRSLGRCPMQIDLAPLSLDDTMQFVRTSLHKAGAAHSIFTDAAVVRLSELTAGIIGQVVAIAESALWRAAQLHSRCVAPDDIEVAADGKVDAA